jgi:hypothetical protein
MLVCTGACLAQEKVSIRETWCLWNAKQLLDQLLLEMAYNDVFYMSCTRNKL